MTATASRSSLVSAANNSSMFPSYFFVSVLYHYLCYYSIYKMHKKYNIFLENKRNTSYSVFLFYSYIHIM